MFNTTSRLTLTLALGATAGIAHAEGDPWALLSQIEIEEIVAPNAYEVRKTLPSALRNGVEAFDITGYAVPLYPVEPGTQTRDILLVSDMGNCPFCGSLDHGGTLQVELEEPMVVEEGQRISLRGALEPVTDPETWQAVLMRKAQVVTF